MPEPEDAGVASIRARLRAAMRTHEQHPDWPCEDWGCADVDDLLRRLDAEHARAERLAAAARAVLDDFDRQVRSHPALDERDPLELYTEPMLRLRAALAGDAL